MTPEPAKVARPKFGGPQVVGYGYAYHVALGGAVVLTRTANGRRAVVARYPKPAPAAPWFAAAKFGNRAGRVF